MNTCAVTSILTCLALLAAAPAFPFCFEEAAREYSLNPRLLESIARTESGMNPRAIGHNRNGSSDYGLMQINSYWVRTTGLSVEKLLGDACYNTKTGASILRGCIDRNGTTWKAVGCYNATSNDKRAKYAWKVFRNLAKSRYGTEGVASAPLPTVLKKDQLTEKNAAELRIAVTDMYTPESGKNLSTITPTPD